MDANNLPGQLDVNQQQLEEANCCDERIARSRRDCDIQGERACGSGRIGQGASQLGRSSPDTGMIYTICCEVLRDDPCFTLSCGPVICR